MDSLYDLQHMDLVHHVVKAFQAYALYKRDVDYVVRWRSHHRRRIYRTLDAGPPLGDGLHPRPWKPKASRSPTRTKPWRR